MLKNGDKNKVKLVATALASILIVGATAMVLHNNSVKKIEASYTNIIVEKDQELEFYTGDAVDVYVVKETLESGITIKESDLTLRTITAKNLPSNAVSDPRKLVGKVLKIKAEKQTTLTTDMVYDPAQLTSDLRKVEYGYVKLPITIQKDDILEFRIVFPNGVSKTVIGKQKLTALDKNSNFVFFNSGAESQLLMDAAFVDMVIHEGELKAIQYVDGEMQETAKVTYMPNKDVISLLKNHPEIVELAKARYIAGEAVRGMLEDALEGINDDYERHDVDLPKGSYVQKRYGSGGATINVINPEVNVESQPSVGNVVTPAPVETPSLGTNVESAPIVDFNSEYTPESPTESASPETEEPVVDSNTETPVIGGD